MKKLTGRYVPLIVIGIIFVLWNILVWVIPDLSNANVYFYCGYGFTALAFIVVACAFLFLKLSKNVTFSVLMPAYIVTGLYFAISFVMNLIFMINLSGTNAKAILIPNIVIVLLYVAAMFIMYFAINRIGDTNKVIDQKVATLKLKSIEIGQIAEIATDAEIKQSLKNLRELVEYSDPIGVEGTVAAETEFANKIAEIRVLVENNYDRDLIVAKIKSAQNKMQERNEILRALK